MLSTLIAPAPLYTFLSYCNESHLDKEILDCGAGGPFPPLALFYENGYKTLGIDQTDSQLRKARKFCIKHGMELNITKGDMRELSFSNESMSFIYSYSSICHMAKIEVKRTIQEIYRVLKKDGLFFVSVCTETDQDFCEGKPSKSGEYVNTEYNKEGVHSIVGNSEPDHYFQSFTCLRKEKIQVKSFGKEKNHCWAELLYFLKKSKS